MRDLMESVLQRAYRIETVATYEEAVQETRDARYDGIVLSVYPGDLERGADVMDDIRSTDRHDTVPILIVGGPFLEHNCEFLQEAGADAVLERPFVQSDLLDTLKETIPNR